MRSLIRLTRIDTGFDKHDVLNFSLDSSTANLTHHKPEEIRSVYLQQQIESSVQAIPGEGVLGARSPRPDRRRLNWRPARGQRQPGAHRPGRQPVLPRLTGRHRLEALLRKAASLGPPGQHAGRPPFAAAVFGAAAPAAAVDMPWPEPEH